MFKHVFRHVLVQTFDCFSRLTFKPRLNSFLNRKRTFCLNIVRLEAESLNRLNTSPRPTLAFIHCSTPILGRSLKVTRRQYEALFPNISDVLSVSRGPHITPKTQALHHSNPELDKPFIKLSKLWNVLVHPEARRPFARDRPQSTEHSRVSRSWRSRLTW